MIIGDGSFAPAYKAPLELLVFVWYADVLIIIIAYTEV